MDILSQNTLATTMSLFIAGIILVVICRQIISLEVVHFVYKCTGCQCLLDASVCLNCTNVFEQAESTSSISASTSNTDVCPPCPTTSSSTDYKVSTSEASKTACPTCICPICSTSSPSPECNCSTTEVTSTVYQPCSTTSLTTEYSDSRTKASATACPPCPIVSPLQANNLTSVTTETYTEGLCYDQGLRTEVIVCGTLNIILTGVVIALSFHIIRTQKRMRSSYESMDFQNSESAATTSVSNFAYSTLNSEQPRPQSVQHNMEQSSVSEYVEMA